MSKLRSAPGVAVSFLFISIVAASLIRTHTAILVVDATGSTPYSTIQSAIDAAIPGQDDVYVRCGFYQENIVMRDDVDLRGAGTGCTIIEGDFGPTVTARDVLTTTTLQGFTIRHREGATGWGVRITDGSPIITGNIIEDNQQAAISIGNISPEPTPVISHNVIRNNWDDYGAGVTVRGSARIVSNLFVGNYGYYAGGLYMLYASVELVNNTITNNAGFLGGAIVVKGENDLTMLNNVVSFNENEMPVWGAAGMTVLGDGTVDFQSNDFFGNIPENFYNVDDPTGINGNISADPEYLDSDHWSFAGFQPRSFSPLVDAGSNTGSPAADLRGVPRPLDGDADGIDVVDIGARENEGLTNLLHTGSLFLWDAGNQQPETYNVYRGDLQVLIDADVYAQSPDTVDGARHFCGLAATNLIDFDDPSEGQVFFYLVTAVGVAEGGLGFDSAARERIRDIPCQEF